MTNPIHLPEIGYHIISVYIVRDIGGTYPAFSNTTVFCDNCWVNPGDTRINATFSGNYLTVNNFEFNVICAKL